MDVIEKLERENPNLNWADWMDAIQKESFEKTVMAWTRSSARYASVAARDPKRPTDTRQVAEPA
jgi:hypothetical protein